MKKLYDIPCIILSGGKSSRMKSDKSLLPFSKNKTLIQYQYDKMSQIFKNVFISSKTDKFDFDCNIIYDKSDIFSPMIAMKSIFEYFDKKDERFIKNENLFIITVDMPFISEDTIDKLIKNHTKNKKEITLSSTQIHINYLCGLYNKKLIKNIENFINEDNHKISLLLNSTNYDVINFENKRDEFININTKSDYKKSQLYI